MTEIILYLISAVILAACGIFALLTGISRRINRKANNIFTVVLILCSIAFAISPYIGYNVMMTRYPQGNDGYMMFAYSYAAVTLLYIAIYYLSFKKNTDNMKKLVFVFSVLIAFIMLLSAVIMFCTGIAYLSVALGLLLKR